MSDVNQKWDIKYERKVLWLLAIGLGLVGLDRYIIMPLFPVIAEDLGLNYQDLGLISAAIAVTWGIASIFGGRISDKIGRRQILIPAVIAFSLFSGLSGMATGLFSLVIIRAGMGIFEGAFVPTSIASVTEASHPSRIGRNVGIQQMALPLLGMAIAPILATQLLDYLPSWHWIFVVISIPGLILAYFMYRHLRNTNTSSTESNTQADGAKNSKGAKWSDLLKYRAVMINAAVMALLLSSLIPLAAFMPNYLTDFLKIDLKTMGFVMAVTGLGGIFGMVIIPALSDRIGRKKVMIVSLFLSIIMLYLLINTGANITQLVIIFFLFYFFLTGSTILILGPLTTQAVPAALTSTAVGLVIGVSEILGGAAAPFIAGIIAQTQGIQNVLWLAFISLIIGSIGALFIKDTKTK